MSATPVTTGPGARLGLAAAEVQLDPDLPRVPVELRTTDGGTRAASYRRGAAGISTSPGAPTLPLEVRDVTSSAGVLRGVALRSGTYTDTGGIIPLTGAPATQNANPHGPFPSTAFYPGRLGTLNYYGAFDGRGTTPDTRLMITPVQYRGGDGGAGTSVERSYSRLGFRTYYSAAVGTYRGRTPALAAPPTITEVSAINVGATDITFRARVQGDPTAGVQQVFVTYTGQPGSAWHGAWRSVDLTQDPDDSTLWTGTLPLGTQQCNEVRFLVQAVNGVGEVGIDDNHGELFAADYTVSRELPTQLRLTTPTQTVAYGDVVDLSAALTIDGGSWPGDVVSLGIGDTAIGALTDDSGTATAHFPVRLTPGRYPTSAFYRGTSFLVDGGEPWSPMTFLIKIPPARANGSIEVTKRPTRLALTRDPTAVQAVLTDAGGAPIANKPVFLLAADATGRALGGRAVATDVRGVAREASTDLPAGAVRVTAYFGSEETPTPADGVIDLGDPLYAAADPVTVR